MMPKCTLAFLTLLFFASCASRQLPDGKHLRLEEVKGLPQNISANCEIYDLTGRLLRSYAGHLCIYESDGSTIIYQAGTLTKFDKSFKTVWQREATSMHHQFQKSVIDDGMLVLDSEYRQSGSKNFRSDIIRVLDKEGLVVKSLNFNEMLDQLRKNGQTVLAPKIRKWLDPVPNMKNLEYSHVNSFAELYDVENGKKILKGYLLNCFMHRKIFILDTSLKRLVEVISTPDRRLHEVQQLSPGKIIFYQNSNPKNSSQKFSSIFTFDFAKREFSEIHSSEKLRLSAKSCSSVQLLGDEQLFITHSNCSRTDEHATFEYVDLKKNVTATLPLDKSKKIYAGYLLDLSEYLKNNAGL